MSGLTQGKIALIIALSILVPSWILMLIFHYLISSFSPFLFLIPFGISIVVYLLSFILIEYYILRKIRILYRTVSSVGEVKPKSDSLQDPELFEKLRLQVQEYALKKSMEIDKLKDNENFRKEFIGNVSHELKTPLFSIQGFLEILRSHELEREERNKYLDKIIKNVERLSTIVTEILTITRAENNSLDLVKENFRIYELVTECIQTLEDTIRRKKINIEIKDSNHIHYTVNADRFRISQVLMNLIENAVFYNPPKTKINIRFFDMESNLLVEIEDNGTGIKERHLSRIFERFYRVDEDRARHRGGSGLGLSIVKNILEAHGQSITVESKFGKGTTFRFTLERV